MDQSHEKQTGSHVLQSPTWVFVCRIFQSLLSKIILAMAAVLMHDAYLDEEGLALAISLITIVAVWYIILTEKIASWRGAYNIIAVIVIDSLLVVLWLATWAAMAAKRAAYTVPVTVNGCTNDGSTIDSETCYRRRAEEQMMKRDVILFKSGLAMTAAIAGLGALVWCLFIACLVHDILGFLKGRKEGRFGASPSTNSPNNNYQLENKIAETQPMSPQTYPSQTQPQPVPFQDAQGQQFQQQQAPPAQYPPQGQVPYQQPQSPAPNPYQGQQQQGYQQYPPQQYQQPIQPQMTGQSQPASTVYSNELEGHQYPPSTVSPPPQQYQQQQHTHTHTQTVYSNELDGNQYPPSAVSPPPQQYQNYPPPQH